VTLAEREKPSGVGRRGPVINLILEGLLKSKRGSPARRGRFIVETRELVNRENHHPKESERVGSFTQVLRGRMPKESKEYINCGLKRDEESHKNTRRGKRRKKAQLEDWSDREKRKFTTTAKGKLSDVWQRHEDWTREV